MYFILVLNYIAFISYHYNINCIFNEMYYLCFLLGLYLIEKKLDLPKFINKLDLPKLI